MLYDREMNFLYAAKLLEHIRSVLEGEPTPLEQAKTDRDPSRAATDRSAERDDIKPPAPRGSITMIDPEIEPTYTLHRRATGPTTPADLAALVPSTARGSTKIPSKAWPSGAQKAAAQPISVDDAAETRSRVPITRNVSANELIPSKSKR